MDKNEKRRLSLVYLLQMGGAFVFVFLIVASLLQWRWSRLGKSVSLTSSHYNWQLRSLLYFIAGALLVLVVPHKITQLLLGYGTMMLLLGRSIYGSFQLRKGLLMPYNLFSRAGE